MTGEISGRGKTHGERERKVLRNIQVGEQKQRERKGDTCNLKQGGKQRESTCERRGRCQTDTPTHREIVRA